MTKDDMTPYDLACMLALQGLLASDLSGKAKTRRLTRQYRRWITKRKGERND